MAKVTSPTTSQKVPCPARSILRGDERGLLKAAWKPPRKIASKPSSRASFGVGFTLNDLPQGGSGPSLVGSVLGDLYLSLETGALTLVTGREMPELSRNAITGGAIISSGDFIWFDAEDVMDFTLGSALQGECAAEECPIYANVGTSGAANVSYEYSSSVAGHKFNVPGRFVMESSDPDLGGVLVTNEPYETSYNDAELRVKNKVSRSTQRNEPANWALRYHGQTTIVPPVTWMV